MIKYEYNAEKATASGICKFAALLIGVLVILDTVSNIKTNGIAAASGFITVILVVTFCTVCGRILDKQVYNHRKWHNYLKENGTKYTGYVEDVLEERRISASDTSGSNRYSYYFTVRYVDLDGKSNLLKTPVLSFIPDKEQRYICDVYEVKQDPGWDEGKGDPTSEVVNITDNEVQISLNPIKIWRALIKSSDQEWFGNTVADNFREQL